MSDYIESMINQQIDQFEINAHIDRGGMANVFLATDTRLGRKVAIKILLPALAVDEQFVARFQREARTAAQLEHPNIVPIYGIGTTGVNQPYIAMQFIEGGDLKSKIAAIHAQGRRIPVKEALQIIRPIADALRVAHAAGVVHRDLKPSNILIRADGSPVLVDMGIAAVKTGDKLTSTGAILGTPSYMSPEQGSERELDGRADIYSLGVILYEMMSGRLPFEAPDALSVLHKHVYEQPPPLETLRPGLPIAVIELVHACLYKDPNRRPQTAAALIQRLDYALAALEAQNLGSAAPVAPAAPRTELLTNPMETFPPPPAATAQPARKRIWPWMLVAVLLVLISGGGYLAFAPNSPYPLFGGDEGDAGAVASSRSDDEEEDNVAEQEAEEDEDIVEEETEPEEATAVPEEPEVSDEEEPTRETIVVIASLTPSPVPTPTPTSAPTATPAPTETPFPYPFVETIGTSVRGAPLEAYQFGRGENVIIFIGGLHAGTAPGTVELANQAILWLTNNRDQVPESSRVIVIPNANPDAPRAVGELDGRLNANRVDLNRNWDCEWVQNARWRNEVIPGSGGTAPFSEPETIALRDFILSQNPRAVIFWEARATNGLSSPGACGDRSRASEGLATTYGLAAGYNIADFEALTSQIVNGDGTNWIDAQGIPSIAVLLTGYETIDWGSNLPAIQAVLRDFGR